MTCSGLVFDLGFHNGDDTAFYLAKGFRVVAVEANPELVSAGRKRFPAAIGDGRLALLQQAISDAVGEIDFFIHPHKSDWSSVFQAMAESDGSQAKRVTVSTTNLTTLVGEHGVPNYLKVDVEGCDSLVAQQLLEVEEKPRFVSFETSRRDYAAVFSHLYVAGYRQYQLVNQSINTTRQIQGLPAGEADTEFQFTPYSSGYFGEDLDQDKWLSFDEMITRYVFYKELKRRDSRELGVGWLDVHARLF